MVPPTKVLRWGARHRFLSLACILFTLAIMSRVFEWIKKHPYYSAAIAAGGVASYMWLLERTSVGAAGRPTRVLMIFLLARLVERRIAQKELDAIIRKNREESERRDRERREKKERDEKASPHFKAPADSPADKHKAEFAEEAVRSVTAAPDFSSSDAYFASEFTTITLNEYRGKWLVIYFVPHEFTLKQVDQLVSLNESLQKFKHFNAELLVVTPESKSQLKTVVDSPRHDGGLGGVDFPLVSDINGTISSKYHAAPSPGDNTTTVIFIDNEGTLLERQQHASDALHATETVLNTLGRLHKEAKSL